MRVQRIPVEFQKHLRGSLTPLGGKVGERFFKKIATRLQRYSSGTVVMMSLESADFVAGENELEVVARFRKKFGQVRSRIFRLMEDENGTKQADWFSRL